MELYFGLSGGISTINREISLFRRSHQQQEQEDVIGSRIKTSCLKYFTALVHMRLHRQLNTISLHFDIPYSMPFYELKELTIIN